MHTQYGYVLRTSVLLLFQHNYPNCVPQVPQEKCSTFHKHGRSQGKHWLDKDPVRRCTCKRPLGRSGPIVTTFAENHIKRNKKGLQSQVECCYEQQPCSLHRHDQAVLPLAQTCHPFVTRGAQGCARAQKATKAYRGVHRGATGYTGVHRHTTGCNRAHRGTHAHEGRGTEVSISNGIHRRTCLRTPNPSCPHWH